MERRPRAEIRGEEVGARLWQDTRQISNNVSTVEGGDAARDHSNAIAKTRGKDMQKRLASEGSTASASILKHETP
jgi:hypothetical protein